MLHFFSDLLFEIIKPIAIKVLQNGNYPQDAIDRKCGIIKRYNNRYMWGFKKIKKYSIL